MINTDRIVPVTAVDLISLYGLILAQDTTNNADLTALEASDPGVFQVTDGTDPLIAAEPVKTLDIDATTSSVSACTVYFVAAYDYEGITIDGAKITPTGTVNADGRTLYKAVLATGAVTITKVGF